MIFKNKYLITFYCFISEDQHVKSTPKADDETGVPEHANASLPFEPAIKTDSQSFTASIEQATSQNKASTDKNKAPNLDHIQKEQTVNTLDEIENTTEQSQPSSEDNAQGSTKDDLFGSDMNFDCAGEVNPTQVPDENIAKPEPELGTSISVKMDKDNTSNSKESGTVISANEAEINLNGGEEPTFTAEFSTVADKESNQNIEDDENRADDNGLFSLELTEDEQFSLNVENLNMRKQDLW